MKLLLLRCPICQEGLLPENEDVVIACPSCHSPILLDEMGLQVAEVQYAATPQPDRAAVWLPFWITHGRVTISSRQTQGGNNRALKDSQAMWGEKRYLYMPAWDMPIPEARQLGKRLVEEQPLLVAGERPPKGLFTAANVTAEDAFKLLEFVILTIEAERSDWLRDLKFKIDAPPPQLWIIPAQDSSGRKLLV